MLLLLTFILYASLAGCAVIRSYQAKQTEQLLTTAGFWRELANTPEKQASLKSLSPATISKVKRNNDIYYIYADPYNCNCLYIGGEAEYQQYKRLEREKKLAEKQMQEYRLQEDKSINTSGRPPWWVNP